MRFLEKIKSIFNSETERKDDEPSIEEINIFKKKYSKLLKNSIELNIDKKYNGNSLSFFGGLPLVPNDFEWPYYNIDSFEDTSGEVKLRPLSFLAQFDCSGLKELDKDNLLPHVGILSFFYSVESNKWGYSPSDKGCSKVYWFEDVSSLSPATKPTDLNLNYFFPKLNINLKIKDSYPDYENLPKEYNCDKYEIFYEFLNKNEEENISKILGWSDTIQGEMREECELIDKGYFLGDTYDSIPKKVLDEVEKKGKNKWVLLFQLASIEIDDFELMFGDSGKLYFWIKKEDLLNKNFDNVWLILQCY